MKAVRLTAIGQPLEEQDVPLPTLEPHEVLVRVRAAGICHSDVHYRKGNSPVGFLPITLGHEVAGVIAETGSEVSSLRAGDRVCLHYMLTCGQCPYCTSGNEQFCQKGKMLGKHANGGYAEYVAVPARSAVPLPEEIPFEQGAILMCSSATVFHALRKAKLRGGETVAIFGAGGLGMSAIQLAKALGALDVYAVDINPEKLRLASGYGAVAVNAAEMDPVAEIRRLTGSTGVDVSLELIGLPKTMSEAIRSLAVFGRAALVGISAQPLELDTYSEIIGREAEIVGVSDHLLSELPLLIEYARRRVLDLAQVVTRAVPLDAGAINGILDELERFCGGVRTVIVPQ